MWLVKRRPLRLAHDPAEDRERICCFACDQAKSVLSEQGQVLARWQASAHRRTAVTSPSQPASTAHLHLRVLSQTLVPPLRPHLHPPLRLGALTVLEDGRGPGLDPRRGSLRRPSVVLASCVMEGGNRRECAAEEE